MLLVSFLFLRSIVKAYLSYKMIGATDAQQADGGMVVCGVSLQLKIQK